MEIFTFLTDYFFKARCLTELSLLNQLSVQVCVCMHVYAHMHILSVANALRIFLGFFDMAHARNVWGSIVGLNVRPSRV